MNPAAQTAALLALATAAALTANTHGPHRIPWRQDWNNHVQTATHQLGVPTATLEAARKIYEDGTTLILDARKPADYATGHIPGSFNIPSTAIATHLPQIAPLLTPAQPILTYCSGATCDESLLLTQHLLQNGFTNITLFLGGWTEWTAAKLPEEK